MIISLLVCGKLKAGLETDLLQDYLSRAKNQGRQIGITDIACQMVPIKPGMSAQKITELAFAAVPRGAKCVLLDETGRDTGSVKFAGTMGNWMDQGIGHIYLMIGPADGWAKGSAASADLVLAFGKWTWPHKLAQVMAAEQIYRGVSILTGSPYHRDGVSQ